MNPSPTPVENRADRPSHVVSTVRYRITRSLYRSGEPPGPWTFYVKRVARSIFNLSLLLDYNLWGLKPGPFHWINWLV